MSRFPIPFSDSMSDPISKPAVPSKPRRWLLFSLRTTLFVVALFGIWLGIVVNRANRQRKAVKAIRAGGGSVVYDYETDEKVWVLKPNAPPPGPAWLRDRIGIDYFATVVGATNGKTDVDDAVAAMKELPTLQSVTLWGKGINNATLSRLLSLPQLRILSVFDSSVTDSGWDVLNGLTQLEALHLHGANVNDATVLHLQGFNALTYLGLTHSEVTDVGLKSIEGLPRLQDLNVSWSNKISATGVQDVKRVLPTVKIQGP
jgi:hypothetical protein